jgi:hypothetical protein
MNKNRIVVEITFGLIVTAVTTAIMVGVSP